MRISDWSSDVCSSDRSYMDRKPDEKQEVLETIDIERRLDKVLSLLNQRIEVLRLSKKISDQTKESMDERQRDYQLREQLRTIQKALVETDEKSADLEALSKGIAKATKIGSASCRDGWCRDG